MQKLPFLVFFLLCYIGFSQEKVNVSLYEIDTNDCFQNSLTIFLQNESFKNVKKKLVISYLTRNDEVIIRIIPLFNDFSYYDELKNCNKTYLDYQGFKVLYFDENYCLQNSENVVEENLSSKLPEDQNKNNESEIQILKLDFPEYYGMEFLYIDGELRWKEENYFGNIYVTQFPSAQFYKDFIYLID